VDKNILLEKGAVSEEVAMAMASGVQQLAGSTLGIGITGIAGPTGGSKEKPVGTVYMAISYPDTGVAETRRFQFDGDRQSVKSQTAEAALQWLCRVLNGS